MKMQKIGLHGVTANHGNLTHLIFVQPRPSKMNRSVLFTSRGESLHDCRDWLFLVVLQTKCQSFAFGLC
jgi:hypothetical protein